MSAEFDETPSSSVGSAAVLNGNVRITRKSPPKDIKKMTETFTPTVFRRLRQYSLSSPPMPWFGIDIGGTLVKLVYFEPDKLPIVNGSGEVLDLEVQSLLTIHRYLMGNTAYGQTGIRDDHLRLNGVHLNNLLGNLHFIRFPSNKMSSFIQMAKDKGLATLSSTVCATGGGAYMWEKVVNEELDLNLFKFDELVSLISGLEFLCQKDPEECYYWENPIKPNCTQVSVLNSPVKYPYLVVNIGSGVSILAVYSEDDFRRITGSSLGGGMFFGLCCLLTGCKTFEEALDLAEKGNNHNVDKLVKDIYGGDYTRFQLSGTTVAASFGQMIDEDKRILASREDLARAALVSITNNIGSIARMAAQTEKIDRVVFVGNFLRVNPIAMKLLANAMEYWSNGAMKALFCRHEGYFGAVGCLLELMRCSEMRRNEKLKMREQLAALSLRDSEEK